MVAVTLERDGVTKTVTPNNNSKSYDNSCFSDAYGTSYHINGVCTLKYVDVTPEQGLWNLVDTKKKTSKEVPGWPPQENDVWKTSNYVMHYVNKHFYFKHIFSDSVAREYTAKDLLDLDSSPILLFRYDGDTV